MKKTLRIPKELTRAATMSEETVGGKKAKRISISSDTPYLRYDWMHDEEYWEVLSHDATDIDATRLALGLPVLFNHNRNEHLGRATKFNNDGHRIDVGTMDDVIWSESDNAQTKKKDVENGSLVGTSVGYSILDAGVCIGAKDEKPIYKFKWAPHEFSFCTMEADVTVGAGRTRSTTNPDGSDIEMREISVEMKNDIDSPQKTTNTRSTAMPPETTTLPATETKINVVAEREDAAEKALQAWETKRGKIEGYIAALKNEAWKKTAIEVSKDYLKVTDRRTFQDFQADAVSKFEGVTQAVETSEINMDKRELRRYSITELIRQAAFNKLDGFYKEKSADVAKLTKRDPEGIWIPDDVSNRSLQEVHGLDSRAMANQSHAIQQLARALTVSVFSAGGALVGTDLLAGSLIELLLNKVNFLTGFIHLGGLVGNVAIPKVTGGQTSYWLPEGGTVTSSNMTFAQLGLVPHRLVASTAYDKQLVAQASLGVEALVRDTIARIMAVEKNRAMINGSGSSGEPLGLLNITGVQTNTTTVNVPTWAQVVNFETKIGTANADLGPMSWLYSPAVQGNLKSLPKIGSTFPVFLQENGMVNGYPVNTTNNVPSGLGIFGVGSEFIVADWAGIDIVVNPFSLDTSGQIRVTVQQWTDNGCRHEVAFVVSTQSMAAA